MRVVPPRSRRPLLALLACLALLLGACSDDLVDVDPGSDDPGAGGGAPDGAPGDQGGGGDTDLADTGPVGSLGPFLLGPSRSRAVLEIDASEGTELAGDARQALADRLATHGGKSVSEAGGNALPAQDVWTRGDLDALSGQHRSQSDDADSVAIYVLVLSGRYEDESVTGLAFNATSFAIWPDRVRGGLVGGLTGSGAAVEEAVVVHELGHLFGLVNLTGQGAFHEDPEHPGHAQSTDSVMYWAVDTDAVSQIFGGPPPSTFNEADVEEMSRIRGG